VKDRVRKKNNCIKREVGDKEIEIKEEIRLD
jgi:hypothetical protein